MAEIDKAKTRLTINAVQTNGIELFRDTVMIGDVRLATSALESFQIISVNIAVPKRDAENLFDAIKRGDVELLVQDIPPKV